MRKECQRINNYHSFIIVLIISDKLPVIAWLLAPWSLKNCSLISPQSLASMINIWCWTSSLPQRLRTWILLKRYPFLLPLPLQWMNLQEYLSLKIHQADLADPTHQTFCLLCGFQIDLLLHIPPHKRKTIQNTTLIWIYFPHIIRQLLTIKSLPKC